LRAPLGASHIPTQQKTPAILILVIGKQGQNIQIYLYKPYIPIGPPVGPGAALPIGPGAEPIPPAAPSGP